MKRLRLYTVVALIAALVGTIIYLRGCSANEAVVRRVIDAPALVQQIQALNELVTVKYTIQKVVGLKEDTGTFSSESVLMLVQAHVRGGIDLRNLTAANVKFGPDRSVTIHLPPPKILDVSIDDKETHVWDRSKTWWTLWVPADKDLEQKARLDALAAVRAAALQMGLLRDARRNAEETIRGFLLACGIESVNFEGSTTPPPKPRTP